MIGILGVRDHPQVGAVCGALEALGSPFVVIDREAGQKLIVTMNSARDGKSAGPGISANFGGHDLADLKVLWSASKSMVARFGSTPEWASEFVTGSNWHSTEYNLMATTGAIVLNPAAAVARCQSKLWQLVTAQRLGFRVPDTVLTNDIPTILDRIRRDGPRIVKMLGDPHIPTLGDGVGQRAILTNDLPEALLNGRPGEREDYPLYTQEKLEKDFELRIVLVGNDQFGFKIDPWQHPIMHTDYRRGGATVEYMIWDIPSDLASAVASMHEAFGLFSGSYDFVVTKGGGYVFLEVNADGMWAPQDDVTEGAISRSFARNLASFAQAGDGGFDSSEVSYELAAAALRSAHR